ncbi:MAG TPA: DUF433 domain-containing protein [Pirellulales bacterium]
MLARDPSVCGGRLCIEGTRFTLNQIVVLYKRGEGPEEIAAHHGQLSLAQVYSSLAYYHAHRAEVEADLAAEHAEAQRLEQALAKPSGQP